MPITRPNQKSTSAGAEERALDDFLVQAESLSAKYLSATGEPEPLDQKLFRHVYARLKREAKRRASSGRKNTITREQLNKINRRLKTVGKKLVSKIEGKSVAEICEAENVPYKTFWRYHTAKPQKLIDLSAELDRIEIFKILSEAKAARHISSEEADNFRAGIESIRKLSEARRNRVKGQKETRRKTGDK